MEAAQAAVLELVPLMEHESILELLGAMDRRIEHCDLETRSAVTQLYAKCGPAIQGCKDSQQLLEELVMPVLLDQAEDMDFQVRRV